MYNTISCLDFRKSSSPNQPPTHMHLLTGEGPETDDQFGVALVTKETKSAKRVSELELRVLHFSAVHFISYFLSRLNI